MDFSNLEAVMAQMRAQGLIPVGQPEKEEVPKAEVDTASPYHSFILYQMVPLNVLKSDHVKRRHDAKRTVVEEQFKNVDEMHIERYGTQIEGVETPRFQIRSKIEGDPRDNELYDVSLDEGFHWLLVAKEKTAYFDEDPDVNTGKFIIDTDECKTGFVRLRIRMPENTTSFKVEHDGKVYISATEISKEFEEAIKLFQTRIGEDPKVEDETTDKTEQENERAKETTADQSNEPKKSESPEWEWHIEKNVLLCFMSPTWPKLASKWPTRERPGAWPPQDVIDKMARKGFVIVPSAHRESQQKDIEWQLYIPTEDLYNTLNDPQLQCYVLLKFLYYQCFATHEILTLEDITMLFFWVIEKTPKMEWTSDSLSKCLNICLEQLLVYITDGNIPHYFFDDHNTIAGSNPEHLAELAASIKAAQENIVETFYKFSDDNLTSYFPVSRSLREIFIEMTTVTEDPKELAVKQHECLRELGMQLLQDRRWSGAVGVLDRFCELHERITGRTLTSEDIMSQHALQSSLDDGIQCYQFMIKHFQRSDNQHSYHGNLACYYHGKYAICEDEQQREGYKKKAEEAFTSALNFPKASAATKTDYANFCLHIDNTEQAIGLAKQIISDESNLSASHGNAYGEAEAQTVPEELQPWIAMKGSIQVLSFIYSHFILIKSYLKVKENQEEKVKEARKIFRQMRTHCAKIWSNREMSDGRETYFESSYFLLGSAAIALNRFKMAVEAFTELDAKIPSELSKTNLAVALSMCGEDETEDEEEEPMPNSAEEKGDQLTGTTGTSSTQADAELLKLLQLEQEIDDLNKSIKRNVSDKNYTEALKASQELSAKYNSFSTGVSQKKSPDQLMYQYVMTLPIANATEFCQFLIDKFPQSPDICTYYNHMGHAYHALYAENEADEPRDELRLRAKEAFEKARKQSPSFSCDYATFLYDTADYPSAIGYLEGIIGEELKKSPEQWLQSAAFYNKTAAKTVDANLQAEIEHADIIEVLPIVYSYYLLVNCCIELEKNSDAVGILTQMKDACDKVVTMATAPLKYKCSSQSLLGYVAKRVMRLDMAKDAFQWVCDNRKGPNDEQDTLALENVDTCAAMLLSIQ